MIKRLILRHKSTSISEVSVATSHLLVWLRWQQVAVIRFDWGMCVSGCQNLLVRGKSTQWGPLGLVLERLGPRAVAMLCADITDHPRARRVLPRTDLP